MDLYLKPYFVKEEELANILLVADIRVVIENKEELYNKILELRKEIKPLEEQRANIKETLENPESDLSDEDKEKLEKELEEIENTIKVKTEMADTIENLPDRQLFSIFFGGFNQLNARKPTKKYYGKYEISYKEWLKYRDSFFKAIVEFEKTDDVDNFSKLVYEDNLEKSLIKNKADFLKFLGTLKKV